MSVGSKCLRGQSVGGSNCWQGQTFIRVKMSAGSKCLWGQCGCEPWGYFLLFLNELKKTFFTSHVGQLPTQ